MSTEQHNNPSAQSSNMTSRAMKPRNRRPPNERQRLNRKAVKRQTGHRRGDEHIHMSLTESQERIKDL